MSPLGGRKSRFGREGSWWRVEHKKGRRCDPGHLVQPSPHDRHVLLSPDEGKHRWYQSTWWLAHAERGVLESLRTFPQSDRQYLGLGVECTGDLELELGFEISSLCASEGCVGPRLDELGFASSEPWKRLLELSRRKSGGNKNYNIRWSQEYKFVINCKARTMERRLCQCNARSSATNTWPLFRV